MHRTTTFRRIAGAAFAIACFSVHGLAWPQGTGKRTELMRTDLGGSQNTEVIMATLELMQGSSVPLHSHHGEEYLYVVEGGSVTTPSGKVIDFKPGATLHFERDEVHGGFAVTGPATIKVLTVHIVDKGKPLYAPAQ